MTVGVLVIDLEVGERRFASRAPVDQLAIAVNQTLAMEPDEDLDHRARETGVEREALAAPVARSAQAAQLIQDAAAVAFAPFPDPLDEGAAPEVVAALALFGEFAFDHVLRRDPGVIGAGHP